MKKPVKCIIPREYDYLDIHEHQYYNLRYFTKDIAKNNNPELHDYYVDTDPIVSSFNKYKEVVNSLNLCKGKNKIDIESQEQTIYKDCINTKLIYPFSVTHSNMPFKLVLNNLEYLDKYDKLQNMFERYHFNEDQLKAVLEHKYYENDLALVKNIIKNPKVKKFRLVNTRIYVLLKYILSTQPMSNTLYELYKVFSSGFFRVEDKVFTNQYLSIEGMKLIAKDTDSVFLSTTNIFQDHDLKDEDVDINVISSVCDYLDQICDTWINSRSYKTTSTNVLNMVYSYHNILVGLRLHPKFNNDIKDLIVGRYTKFVKTTVIDTLEKWCNDSKLSKYNLNNSATIITEILERRSQIELDYLDTDAFTHLLAITYKIDTTIDRVDGIADSFLISIDTIMDEYNWFKNTDFAKDIKLIHKKDNDIATYEILYNGVYG